MRTDVCGGGGLSIIDGELDGSAGNAVIHSTTFNENFGPGVASIAPLRLVDVTANANTGPGVLVATDSPDAVDFSSTVLEVKGSSILDNLGSGVVIMEGTARFEDDVSVLRNHASGLRVVTGNVFLNETSGVTRIERNGLMNDSCWVWDFDRGDFRGEMIVASTDAGVDIGNGNLTASGPVIQDNGGEGVLIPLDSPMSGVATVTGGTICNNGSPDFVAMMNYTGVTTSCP